MLIETERLQEPAAFENYDRAKLRINRLLDDWSEEVSRSKNNRKTRLIDLNVAEMRSTSELGPNEAFIPERVIDTNISREKPAFINFLNQARRLAIFRSLDKPTQSTVRLEKEFTQGLTYKGWERDYDRVVDGGITHGWDSVEVVFDTTKPLHVAVEHVGHDRLFWNKKVDDIQSSDFVVRKYEITTIRLEFAVTEYGFNPEQVAFLLQKDGNRQAEDTTFDIYKVMFKTPSGIVNVGWYSRQGDVTNWLKDPVPLKLGIYAPTSGPMDGMATSNADPQQGGSVGPESFEDTPLDMYPFFVYTYREDEEQAITKKVGRVFLDEFRQEAHTALLTSVVNSFIRASDVYASPEEADSHEASLRQLDINLVNGSIFNKKMNFFHMDYPDSTVVSVLQYLNTTNSQQTGQLNYAVMNRKDARKTAKEIESAETEENALKAVGLTSFSAFLRDVLSFAWRIVQSQALLQHVPILRHPVVMQTPVVDPATGITMGQTEQVVWQNDLEILSQNYEVRSAGDTDVVERAQRIGQMKQDWPVIQGMGNMELAVEFLSDLLILLYPEDGEKYVKILKAGDQGKAIIQSLLQLLQGSMTPEDVQQVSPEQQQQLTQIIQGAQEYLGRGQEQA